MCLDPSAVLFANGTTLLTRQAIKGGKVIC